MKTFKPFFSVLALIILATFSLTAQVEVVTNGKVKLGNPRPNDDLNNEISSSDETTISTKNFATGLYMIRLSVESVQKTYQIVKI